MKTLKSLFITASITALLTPALAKADFGEIDILVQESIENHFKEYGREVDLTTLDYNENSVTSGSKLEIHSSVKAQQGYTGDWGWHDCVTTIEVNSDYMSDLGSECTYQME